MSTATTLKGIIALTVCIVGLWTDGSTQARRTRSGTSNRGSVNAQKPLEGNADSAYEKQEWVSPKGDTLRYRILLPLDFNPETAYPLVLFLHGAGERGADNTKQLVHGANLFLQPQNLKDYPAIIVFPQCAANDFWSNVSIVINDTTQKREFVFQESGPQTPAMQLLLDWLPQCEKKYKIKADQRYVMGLSMGGMGTFELVRRKPGYFAGAIPICGGANPKTAPFIVKTAFWIFHGEKDDVVPLKYSEQMVKAIQQVNQRAEMNFTVYSNTAHNSWDKAFAEPELLSWLFSQRMNR